MPGATVRLERYAAFLPLACSVLGAGLAGFNFGDRLFISVASVDTTVLQPAAACIDGPATLCFPAD